MSTTRVSTRGLPCDPYLRLAAVIPFPCCVMYVFTLAFYLRDQSYITRHNSSMLHICMSDRRFGISCPSTNAMHFFCLCGITGHNIRTDGISLEPSVGAGKGTSYIDFQYLCLYSVINSLFLPIDGRKSALKGSEKIQRRQRSGPRICAQRMKYLHRVNALLSLLLVSFGPLFGACQQCGKCPQNSIDYNVELKFVKEGDESIIEYTDSTYGNLRVKVPRFFFGLSKERILNEIHESFEGSSWSERVIMEIFYYAVTYGTDHKPENRTSKDAKTGLEGVWNLESTDPCQWEGVVCGPLAKDNPLESEIDYKPPCHAVTSIDLMESNLHGTLPFELHHLEHLSRLNLNDNFLHGTIPTQYGRFEHLRFLDLGDNKLSGTIPHHLAALAPTLEELWLEKNIFTGIIDYGLCQLTNVRFMDLSQNKLNGTMPTEIGHLTSLGSLFLEDNNLSGTIVPELGMLPSLRVIDLGVNEFTGSIPSEIGLCTSLIDFNVASNRLNESIPLEIFYLTNLEVLMLSENEFTGTLPEGDDKVPGRVLETPIDEDGTPIPFGYAWADFTEMVALAIDRNNFAGTFPPQLLYGLAPSLTSLDIGFNFFTGTLPNEIGRMTMLTRFSTPYNFFTGTGTLFSFVCHMYPVVP